jgi:hypothetical protein
MKDLEELKEVLDDFYESMLKATNSEQQELIEEYAKLILEDF